MHAASERLADNIAEHEDAAGYRVGDFGIASRANRSGCLVLPAMRPTITVRADIIGCLRCEVYGATTHAHREWGLARARQLEINTNYFQI